MITLDTIQRARIAAEWHMKQAYRFTRDQKMPWESRNRPETWRIFARIFRQLDEQPKVLP